MAILKASLEVLVVAVPVVDKICFNNHNHILQYTNTLENITFKYSTGYVTSTVTPHYSTTVLRG